MGEFDAVQVLQLAFPTVAEIALASLASLMRVRTYAAGDLICHEGAFEDTFYVIGTGEVEFTKRFTADEERQLRTGGPGIYFGEMALVQGEARNANVRALTEVQVLEIDKTGFSGAIETNPAMMLDILRTVIDRMRSNDATALEEMRKQRDQITDAYDELRHQEQLRTEFLTTMAHELRTPLTAASGYMQLVKSGAMSGPALGMALEKIGTNVDRIVSLVNDLLFVQEQDLIEPVLRQVSLPALLAIVIDELRDEAHIRGCKIKTKIPPDLPTLQADPDGLVRAFNKLLDNAVKFSPDGGDIDITARLDDHWVDVEFRDRGVGISASFLPRIFQRFERTDRIADRVYGGVGLGLSIAKHIIESHGGSITADSKVGQGSTFTVRLPLDGGRTEIGGPAAESAPPDAGSDSWVDASGEG